MPKQAILLINLGTPDHCTPRAVRRYLKEFLNDPRVVHLPWFIRWFLINLVIIPFRYKKSTHAYQQIWTKEGSPLLINAYKLQEELQKKVGDAYRVVTGMRYGNPSIASALEQIRDCERLIVIPLFPQYSSAATGSAIENVMRGLIKKHNIPEVVIKNHFYDDPFFVNAVAEQIRAVTCNHRIDRFIFSYHGLPEHHLPKSECRALCDRINACPVISDENAFCYRAQCFATSRLLAETLSLKETDYVVSFQSRLGRTSWIKPYSDELLQLLRQEEVKNIAVVCPSFVADCLETLEEINIRLREQWKSLGGENFILVPCVNDSALFVEGLVGLL